MVVVVVVRAVTEAPAAIRLVVIVDTETVEVFVDTMSVDAESVAFVEFVFCKDEAVVVVTPAIATMNKDVQEGIW